MASSTSLPASQSQSKKPLGKMAGEWTQIPISVLAPKSIVLSLHVGEVGGLPGPNTGRVTERLTRGQHSSLDFSACALWIVRRKMCISEFFGGFFNSFGSKVF